MPMEAQATPAPALQPQKAFPVSWDQFHRDCRALTWRLAGADRFQGIVCVTRGGLVARAQRGGGVVRGGGARVEDHVAAGDEEGHEVVVAKVLQTQRGRFPREEIGERLLVETDGRENHAGAERRHNDLVRDANAAAWGYVTLRFDYALVVHDWDLVERAILGAAGLLTGAGSAH